MGKVVNFFGSPGAGKSTSAAELFSALKRANYRAELVTEYAKDIVYRGDHNTLRCQSLIFGKQLHRIERSLSIVDYVVTDSPILLSAIYGEHETAEFRQNAVDKFKSFDNINFFITLNVDNYKSYGRMQTAQESEEIESKILQMLNQEGLPFQYVRNGFDAFDLLRVQTKE
jgi:energy-coupling factor transporter ATP-binding protein EcfA2